ncbi:MAG: hypothetical protein JRN20_14920 [Nitrososphaerota archaeon]|nr:hypothetical protein [Nitrososphaerota archaeon]
MENRALDAAEWLLRAISLAAIVFALVVIFLHQFLIYTLGYISTVSLGSAGALFILSEYSFSKSGLGKVGAIIFGILFPAAFLESYEIIYHFSFTPSPHFNTFAVIGGGIRFLATDGVVILPLVYLRNHLEFRNSSKITLIVFAGFWLIWLLYGYPQYYTQSPMYYPPILKTSDYWDTSLFLNFGSKIVLAFFFASILKLSYRQETSKLLHRLRMGKYVSSVYC